jgi:predicted amidohydrolase YtcJ
MGGLFRKVIMALRGIVLSMLPAFVLSTGCAIHRVDPNADVYYNFTMVDPAAEKRVENAWVVVEAGRLSRIGTGRVPRSLDPARSHDLGGRYVLPGLIDAHAHITATGILQVDVVNGAQVLSMKVDEAITRRNARMALARGVTTVRNPAGSPEANAHYDLPVPVPAWTSRCSRSRTALSMAATMACWPGREAPPGTAPTAAARS